MHHRTLEGLGERVRAFCDQVGHRLGQFDFEQKRLAMQALQIKVVAGKEGARLLGAIPTNLATIEQTSAYMCQNDVARIPIEIPLAA